MLFKISNNIDADPFVITNNNKFDKQGCRINKRVQKLNYVQFLTEMIKMQPDNDNNKL